MSLESLSCNPTRTSLRRGHGFTLVELGVTMVILALLAWGVSSVLGSRSDSAHLSNTYTFFGKVEEVAARWQARSSDSLRDYRSGGTNSPSELKDEFVRLGLNGESSWGDPWAIADVDTFDSSFYNSIIIEYPMGVDDATDGEDLAERLESEKEAVVDASYDSEMLTVQLEIS